MHMCCITQHFQYDSQLYLLLYDSKLPSPDQHRLECCLRQKLVLNLQAICQELLSWSTISLFLLALMGKCLHGLRG